MLPILMLMDAFAVRQWWGCWNSPICESWCPAVAGIVLGAFTFRFLSDGAIRVLIGLIAVGFVANHFIGVLRSASAVGEQGSAANRRRLLGRASGSRASASTRRSARQRLSAAAGIDKGTFQATSVLLHDRELVRAAYALLGQFDFGNLSTSLVLAPLAPIGIRLGHWLHHKIDETWFFRFIYVSLLIVGVRLIWLGLR